MMPGRLRHALVALLQDQPLVYVDCGARAGRMPRSFRQLKEFEYVGFEADADECARLNARALPRHRYLPAVLGRARERRTFYLTRDPACASLIPPNVSLLEQFAGIREQFAVERTLDVETIGLDECLNANGIGRVDFLKLDTQGTELEILAGAETTLGSVLGVQTEVEFAPMYEAQPLFADVDGFMRARGFHLFDLARYHVRRSTIDPGIHTRGQLLWGQALYVRDHRAPDDAVRARLAVLALLLDLPDLAIGLAQALAETATEPSLRHKAAEMCAETTSASAAGGAPSNARAVWRD